jgi:histidinol-phosphatase (PHP family)
MLKEKVIIDTGVDCHVHTKLCHHAEGEMEEYVLSAVDKGLRGIIFLEHMEVGINYFESTWLTEDDFNYYHEEGRRLQDKYRDAIDIGLGIEVGYNPDFLDEIKRCLALHEWDLIGISYHYLETGSGHLNLVSRRQSNIDALDELGVDTVIEHYYKHLLDAVENLPGQILCHIDAALRHHPNVTPNTRHEGLIDELLDRVAEKKMALEINTAG